MTTRYQGGNQKPQNEEGQTTQWLKDKKTNRNLQNTTHTNLRLSNNFFVHLSLGQVVWSSTCPKANIDCFCILFTPTFSYFLIVRIQFTLVVMSQTRLNVETSQTHLNVESSQTHLNVETSQTHLNVETSQTHLNVESSQTHLKVES
jgi:hypothetical protein